MPHVNPTGRGQVFLENFPLMDGLGSTEPKGRVSQAQRTGQGSTLAWMAGDHHSVTCPFPDLVQVRTACLGIREDFVSHTHFMTSWVLLVPVTCSWWVTRTTVFPLSAFLMHSSKTCFPTWASTADSGSSSR